jgi:hypothetical protein
VQGLLPTADFLINLFKPQLAPGWAARPRHSKLYSPLDFKINGHGSSHVIHKYLPSSLSMSIKKCFLCLALSVSAAQREEPGRGYGEAVRLRRRLRCPCPPAALPHLLLLLLLYQAPSSSRRKAADRSSVTSSLGFGPSGGARPHGRAPPRRSRRPSPRCLPGSGTPGVADLGAAALGGGGLPSLPATGTGVPRVVGYPIWSPSPLRATSRRRSVQLCKSSIFLMVYEQTLCQLWVAISFFCKRLSLDCT